MRFLLITKEYPPTPDPSGQIVSYLADSLRKKGHFVDIIARVSTTVSTTNCIERESIFQLKTTYWDRLSQRIHNGKTNIALKTWYFIIKYARKVYLALNIVKFPDSEPSITKEIIRLFENELLENEYDCVIGFFRPYSGLAAATAIKNKTTKTKEIAYYLDLVEPRDCPKLMSQKIYNTLVIRGDKYIFENSELIILPVSAKKVLNPLYAEYEKKIIYCEFPTFIQSAYSQLRLAKETNNGIVLLFAGTLDSNFRNPLKLLYLFNDIAARSPQKVITLKFYGGGDCFDIIDKYEHCGNLHIEQHGLVKKEIINCEMAKANFLINLANTYSAIVPSKIFELFASCKPIINVVSGNNDGSEDYFSKYPLCFVAKWDKKNEWQLVVESLLSFMNDNANKTANIEEVRKIYYTCTPDYVADQILNGIKGLK